MQALKRIAFAGVVSLSVAGLSRADDLRPPVEAQPITVPQQAAPAQPAPATTRLAPVAVSNQPAVVTAEPRRGLLRRLFGRRSENVVAQPAGGPIRTLPAEAPKGQTLPTPGK